MKKLLIIPLLFLCFSLFGQDTYYVSAITGNDGDSGADTANAFLTIQHGIDQLDEAGDSLFLLTGTWYPTAWIEVGNVDGTYGNDICIFAYPGNTPVIDGTNLIRTGTTNYGIRFTFSDYWHIKGITVRNVSQGVTDDNVRGIYQNSCNNITHTQCVVHNVEGHGFQCYLSDSIRYYNCDSYNNVDSLNHSPGETSDGFNSWPQAGVTDAYTYYYGCRAWSNGDDGWDSDNEGLIIYDRCWAWDNGKLAGGDGNGFKYLTGNTVDINYVERRLINCVSAYNKATGFHENSATLNHNFETYNCIAYKNGWAGFYVPSNGSVYPDHEMIYKNNIAYDNVTYQMRSLWNQETASYNSWNTPPGVTLSDADFISVDSAGLSGARTAWGGLPVLTFLHIDTGSDLIGAGIGVGLTYDGDSLYHNDPPDLGAFAYDAAEPSPPELPQVTTALTSYASVRAVVAGNVTDDGGGTVSARGICFDTSVNPTTGDNIVPSASGTGAFSCTLILEANTTYYVRAYATGSVAGTGYGTNIQIDTHATSPISSGGYIITNGSGNIIIE